MPSLYVVSCETDRLTRLNDIISGALAGGQYHPHEIAILAFESTSVITGKLCGVRVSALVQPENICCTTIRRFKGLEAKMVIILDASAQSLLKEQGCREFYVGSSRAMQELHILFLAHDDEEIASVTDAISKRDGRKLRRGVRGLKQLLNTEITKL